MSVPKDSRTESKLQVFVLARNLTAYTLQITSNDKTFPPKLHACTDEIIRLAMLINTQLWTANNVLVNSPQSYRRRREEQDSACANCNALLATIDVAAKLYHLSTKRVKYWASQVIEVRNKARAWRDSDTKRYAEYR